MKYGKRISKESLLVCGVCLALAAAVVWVIFFLSRTGSDTKSFMQEWFCDASFSRALYGDKGLFEYGDRGIVYIDAKTRKETPICQKIGCQHNNADCDGWIESISRLLVFF